MWMGGNKPCSKAAAQTLRAFRLADELSLLRVK